MRAELACALLAVAAGATPAAAQRVEWPHYGGDPGQMRYSVLTDIDRSNVHRLREVWEWRTSEGPYKRKPPGRAARPGKFEATPLMLGDTLYLTTPYNRAVALDAETGRELWSYDPGAVRWGQPFHRHGFVHRGLAATVVSGRRRLFLASLWRLIALDAATGRPIAGFGRDGEIDLTEVMGWRGDKRHVTNTSPPVAYRGLVIVGSSIPDDVTYPGDPPGAVLAFDAATGALRWSFYTVPRRGQFGYETWESGSADSVGHTNVWSVMAVDTARGLIYLPVSTPSNDWYGARRWGDNLFGESIVCLDALTGRRRWHFQLVRHGLWDYDVAAPPVLGTVRRAGGSVDIVMVAGKTGFLYVFDRVSGVPVWPMEERPVPPSDVPGERAAQTQPFPTWPLPFARQGFSAQDVVDFTPEIRRAMLDSLRGVRFGPIFTPPSVEGTMVSPGVFGGAAWGGAAYDPESQTLFVKGNNHPVIARLGRMESRSDTIDADFVVQPDQSGRRIPPDRLFRRVQNLFGKTSDDTVRIPFNKPPYGTMTAIDLASGRHRWQVAVGDTPEVRRHPALRGLRLPPLGRLGASGAMVTRAGLIFVAGDNPVLYALDTRDGRVLWEGALGGEGFGSPMTYRTVSGRQFVVVAVGRRDARLKAFALSEPATPPR